MAAQAYLKRWSLRNLWHTLYFAIRSHHSDLGTTTAQHTFVIANLSTQLRNFTNIFNPEAKVKEKFAITLPFFHPDLDAANLVGFMSHPSVINLLSPEFITRFGPSPSLQFKYCNSLKNIVNNTNSYAREPPYSGVCQCSTNPLFAKYCDASKDGHVYTADTTILNIFHPDLGELADLGYTFRPHNTASVPLFNKTSKRRQLNASTTFTETLQAAFTAALDRGIAEHGITSPQIRDALHNWGRAVTSLAISHVQKLHKTTERASINPVHILDADKKAGLEAAFEHLAITAMDKVSTKPVIVCKVLYDQTQAKHLESEAFVQCQQAPADIIATIDQAPI
jgi:hypothetical protein